MNLIAKLLMNSLYGKFGMKLDSTKVEIVNNNSNKLSKYLDKYNSNIEDIIYLDNHTVLIVNNTKFTPTEESEESDIYHGQDVNIAIASAITAYGRIHMSLFKNNPNFNLYYSDTDSAVVDSELPKSFIGDKLGKLKLEYTIDKAVFLAPKVYGLIDVDGIELIKAKGLTKDSIRNIKVSDLEQLLVKDASKVFTQSKGYKELFEGHISISDILYTLSATSSKRRHIYENGRFINTKPFTYDEIISNK
jgi:DNA polymerase type B, organellar and viral